MKLLNETVLRIIIVTVVPVALILITAITSPIKDKDINKHNSTNNIQIERRLNGYALLSDQYIQNLKATKQFDRHTNDTVLTIYSEQIDQ